MMTDEAKKGTSKKSNILTSCNLVVICLGDFSSDFNHIDDILSKFGDKWKTQQKMLTDDSKLIDNLNEAKYKPIQRLFAKNTIIKCNLISFAPIFDSKHLFVDTKKVPWGKFRSFGWYMNTMYNSQSIDQIKCLVSGNPGPMTWIKFNFFH